MKNGGKSGSCVVLLLGAHLALAVATSGCDDKPGKSESSAPDASTPSATVSALATASAPAASASVAAPASAPDTVAAQHVLVAYKGADKAPKGVTRTKAEAKKRAEEVASKANAGADFSALVAEYSDDPAAKERQGSVGKFTRDKMAKPFSDAAFALAVGATSGAVETPFGFHVIKRNQ
jgi:parvulin-like peptidyl-prolyl isomerase